MRKISILYFGPRGGRLSDMVAAATADCDSVELDPFTENQWKGKRLLVAVEVDPIGGNDQLYQWLRSLYAKGRMPLFGSIVGIVVNSQTALYTKRVAQYALFHLNRLGSRAIGHPLVEATAELENFQTWQKAVQKPLHEICMGICKQLGNRLRDFSLKPVEKPKLLMLHASSRETSNTLMLWNMIAQNLPDAEIEEYHIQDDKIAECKGCTFKTCMHYSDMRSCYYGGIMVDQILPAIEAADGMVWICPNYNDAISAKLMAVINRLTVLYRRISFMEKRLFGIIVSGNSGSDLVATQLLGALTINKGFMLPPSFSMMAIANDPGSILDVAGIQDQAKAFGEQIMGEFHTEF